MQGLVGCIGVVVGNNTGFHPLEDSILSLSYFCITDKSSRLIHHLHFVQQRYPCNSYCLITIRPPLENTNYTDIFVVQNANDEG